MTTARLSFILLSLFSLSFNVSILSQAGSYPPTGKLFDAGGHLLHINVAGKGTPTVILENGSGDFSFIWSLVQPAIARFARVVSYDRAGYAWSEAGPTPRTDKQITLELHTALRNAGINPPYVLVGQSYGGFLVRAFANYYPKEVVGMILVDAVHENERIMMGDQPTRIRELAKGLRAPEPISYWKEKKIIADKPLVLDSNIEYPLNRLSKNIQQWQIWAQSQPGYRVAVGKEMDWSPEDVNRLFKDHDNNLHPLHDIPLIVLSKGKGAYNGRLDSTELEKDRLKLQDDLSRLSTNGLHIIDKKSGHNIHVEDPGLVIQSIRKVVYAARTGEKLKADNNNKVY